MRLAISGRVYGSYLATCVGYGRELLQSMVEHSF